MNVSRFWKPVSGAVGIECKLEVEVTIKQLVDCPLQNRDLFVKLKWGRGVWGVREDLSTTQPCTNRIVEWNDTFKHQCAVYIEGPALPEDQQKRELLLKKQPSSAYLRMSLRKQADKDSESKPFAGKNKRYAYVDVNLVEWALAYGDGKMHTDRRLLHGTNANSYLTLEITIRWPVDSPIGYTTGNASFDGSGKPPFVVQKIPSMLPPMEDCPEAPMGGGNAQSLQHAPSYWSEKQQDEEELNDRQLQFLQAGASRAVVGFGAGEDRVSAAIAATRMTPEECLSLIDNIFKKTLGDKDMASQSASATLLALRI
eukprot:CAMPEP_0206236474 /NCGR_PEP_ID=MMETSP0047_2-20121206/13738_1 /ASSEMBLY_ACC=CAM_ASM_000192 /TAXON_ID=195065 /ORGANISM="Chroomonas mesostigmatica_cf, Strain CCMP1168" /LENGTH=312 /DNA_ID=CAMNT_0053660819 /DNA_START=197 /DNA_END=1135 /DNA_ORIENTATION=+